MKNYYEALQIFPKASQPEIKEAFRFLLFRYHPDHNRHREEWAVERTMELVEAYHVLSSPARRAHHDLMRGVRLRDEPARKGFGLFGGGKGKQVREMFQQGIQSFKADEHEQAIRTFRKVQEMDTEYPNAKYNLALGFMAIERYLDAMQLLQEHLAKNRQDAEARALYPKISQLAAKKKAGS